MQDNAHRFCAVLALVLALAACSGEGPGKETPWKSFSLDAAGGLLCPGGPEQDQFQKCSSDGKVLTVEALDTTTVGLFAVDNPGVDETVLEYRAGLKGIDLTDRAYLELLVTYKGKTYFSRGLDSPVAAGSAWREASAPFILKKGQAPEKLMLNLVVEGRGRVQVRDVALYARPLSGK